MSRTLYILAVVASVSVANAAFVNPVGAASNLANKISSAAAGLNAVAGADVFPSFVADADAKDFASVKNLISNKISTIFNNYLNVVGSVKGNPANETERKEREQNLAAKLSQILEHNFKGLSYILGLNQFSDMSDSEFKSKYRNAIPETDLSGESSSNSNSNSSAGVDQNLGSNGRSKRQASGSCGCKDWREGGFVTPIRDQKQCGSCYAFGSTGTLEAMMAIKCGTKNVDLSEQDLMDCSKPQGNPGGCSGGNAKNSFTYFQQSGLALESDYPYTVKDGECRNPAPKRQGKVATWQRMSPLNDENAMTCALNSVGPMAVMVDATGWSAYKGGVFGGQDTPAVTTTTTTTQKPSLFGSIISMPFKAGAAVIDAFSKGVAPVSTVPCSSSASKADHLVVVVGCGVDEKSGPYWVIKNSWGAAWGEQGYIRIAKGANICGVSNNPMQVTDVQCQ